jgi:uncharacterized protein YjdB
MKARAFSIVLSLSLLGALSIVAGCAGSSSSSAPTLQSIAVTPATPTIVIAGTQQFKAMGAYSDGSSDLTATAVWSSSDSGVATVSASGMATAVAAGGATIFAKSGGVTGQATVTVPAATLQSIAVTPAAPTVAIGGAQQFKATGTYSDTSTKDLTATVTWTSDNLSAATVSASGLATAVAAGSSNIIATASGGVHGQATITVPVPTLQSVAVTPASPTVAIGGTQQFKATGTYSDTSTKDLTATVTWTSDNLSSATVSASGLATAVAAGRANIIATSSGGVHGQATITVPAPTLHSIAVTPATPTIAIGGTQQFKATGTYSDSSTKDLTATSTWTSDNTSAATVSASGFATAVAAGSANIIATDSSGVSGQTSVTVPTALKSIVVASTGSLTMPIGGVAQFKATGAYSDLSSKDLTSTVAWSSDNLSVATVSSAGLVTAVAAGSADIIAASGGLQNQATITVPAAVRTYSASASVGDFITISIDQTNSTISYVNLSNGAVGGGVGDVITYTSDFNGNTTLNDPAGHLLSLSEVPGLGFVALINNAGSTQDQLALVSGVSQQNVTTASFENQSYNIFEFRTTGGGVGIASIALDAVGNINGTEYMPSNLLGCGGGNCGFNLLQFALPSTTIPSPYLTLALPRPPSSTGNNYIFGTSNGMFLDDSEDGSIVGLPKAASKNFDPSWANTYTLTYYQKTDAYGPDGNSLEAGNISWGVATLILDISGKLSLVDSKGNPMASGLLVAVADTASLYNGTTTSGQGTPGELGDQCFGLFTFTAINGGQTQQVFVAFSQGAVLLSSFSTGGYNGGDTYNYFYGVGTPQSSTSTASNIGNSENPGGSSTANPPGAWNSLGSSVSPTAQRLYVGSSAGGDLLTFTIDPVAGTLSYYDVNNGNRASIPYTMNADGSSTVDDPGYNVLSALELPDQALFVEINNTGFNQPPVPDGETPICIDAPDLVVALPQMNLTTADFAGQNYNFIEIEGANQPNSSSNGDMAIGSMAMDASANFTGSGFTPWATLQGENMFTSPFNNLDPLTFPSGDYPGPWIATTDVAPNSNLDERGDYLFGYPGSLAILNIATQGTVIGFPQSASAAFQPTVGGNPLTGTYQVMFFRRQVTGFDQYGENGPTGTPSGTPPNCSGGWKCLQQTRGASMGFATLTIASDGTVTLTDTSNSSVAWTGTLAPVSGQSSLAGTGELAAACCNGLFTVTGSAGAWPLVSNLGAANQQNMQIFIGFVPGAQPAVVISTFTTQPNATPAPSATAYQYRYGMGFRTGP